MSNVMSNVQRRLREVTLTDADSGPDATTPRPWTEDQDKVSVIFSVSRFI
jgi:hypothetical protein